MLDHPVDDSYAEKIEKMVNLTVAAATGMVPLGQVVLPLNQIAHSDLAPPEVRNLAYVLNRILQGERDPVALVETLSPELAEVVWDILDQIEVPLPQVDQAEWIGLTFEQLIEKVAEACSGEVLLWQQLWQLTGQLAGDDTLPGEIQSLGVVLRKILAGERQKFILAELAPPHRVAVEQLLDWLNARTFTPQDK